MIRTSTGIQLPDPQDIEPIEPDDPFKVVYPDINDLNERKIASELRQRFLEWNSANQEFYKRSTFELDFLFNHWIAEENGTDFGAMMLNAGRSAFNIDLLTPSLESVVNQERINKLTANFVPVSEGADEATADIRQGLYRNIDRESNAAIARETGYQFAVSVGRGYWRVLIEDEEGPTVAKKIGIQRVDNLNSVAIDPTCLEFTYGDAAWAFVYDDMWKQEFREQFGKDADNNVVPVDIMGLGLDEPVRDLWFPKDKVRVGEYFRKVWKKRIVWKLADGQEMWADEAAKSGVQESQAVIIKEKMDSYIEWRKMTGIQTLEKRRWPGKYIPLVVCIGREIFRGTKPKLHSGMIRPAIDPSRIHDAMFSRMVDEVGFGPLPHMISPVGALSPEQSKIVNTINKHPWSVVEYTPAQDSEGRQLPAPHWESPGVNTAAVVQAAELASEKLDRVLSVFAPQRGQPVNSQSGKAIKEIKDQGDVSHAAFPDNFRRALLHEARIVNDLMDVVYTDAQAITITQPDEKTQRILINQEFQDEKTGKVKKYLFGAGKYGVVIDVATAYPTRMAEAAQRLLQLAEIFPGPFAQVLDLVIQDLNIPAADKYRDRLRPPGIKDDEDGPSNVQLQQQIAKMGQDAQQADDLIKKLLDKVDELGSEEAIRRLEIASKEKIAAAGDQTSILVAAMKDDARAQQSVLGARLQFILDSMENNPESGQPPVDPMAGAPPTAAPAPPQIQPTQPQPLSDGSGPLIQPPSEPVAS